MKHFTDSQKKRLFYLIATVLLLMTEVLIALFVHDLFIRPYVGDVLVVVVIYTFLRIFFPERPKLLPLFIFLFAAGVELLQYFELVKVLGLEGNPFLRTLIGTTFDAKDIVCYGVGTVITGIWELTRTREHISL